MDFCSLDDAFPNWNSDPGAPSGVPSVNGTDTVATKEERRAARKKAKKCRQAAAAVDPDRPAVQRLETVEAMNNPWSTQKIYEKPIGQRPLGRLPGSNCLFIDQGLPESFTRSTLSGTNYIGNDVYAAFTAQLEVDASGAEVGALVPEASQIKKDAKTAREAAASLKANPYPAYFGKGEEDPLEEPFAGYLQSPGTGTDDPSYRLVPDFTKVFDFKGLEKAAGGGPAGALPGPNLEDAWKPHSRGATYTAFTESPGGQGAGSGEMDWSLTQDERGGPRAGPWTPELPEPPAEPVPRAPPSEQGSAQKGVEEKVLPAGGNPQEDRDQLRARVAELQGRLEAIQKQKEQNTQEELLLFVGTGLMVLLTFHLASRC